MKIQTIQSIIMFISGGLIALESLMLLVGTNISGISPWTNPKNITFALTDIIFGAYLVFSVFSAKAQTDTIFRILFYSASIILLLTHGIRAAEYLSGADNPFLFNKPLYIFNWVRTGFLVSLLIITLSV